MGPKLMNWCKPEQMGIKECGKMLERIQVLEDGRVPAKKASKKLEDRRTKEKNYEKRVSEACKQGRNGRCHGPTRIKESRQRKGAAG